MKDCACQVNIFSARDIPPASVMAYLLPAQPGEQRLVIDHLRPHVRIIELLPSLQLRDHPPRLGGKVIEPAAFLAIRVVRCRLVECEGMASSLDTVAISSPP